MNKEDILKYVTETPGNTNPNVLKPMLDELEGDKLPPVTEADKDKYLHTNAQTGNTEWEDTFPEMKGKTIHHDAVVELLDSVNAGRPANITKQGQDITGHYGYIWSLNHYSISLEVDYAMVTDDNRHYAVSGDGVVIGITGPLSNWGYTNIGELEGKTISFYKIISEPYDEEIFPSNVINMYDENDPHGDGTYLPLYISEGEEAYIVDRTFDSSEIYERLVRGLNVWIRSDIDRFESVLFIQLNISTNSIVAIQGASGTILMFDSDTVSDEDIEDQGGDTTVK